MASAEGGGTSSSRLCAWHQPAASQHLRGSPVAFVHSLLCDRCDSHAVEDSMTSHVLCGPAACHQGTRPKDRRVSLQPLRGPFPTAPGDAPAGEGGVPLFWKSSGGGASHVLLKKKTAGVSARCQPIRGWSDLYNKNGRIWSKRAHTGTIATMAMRRPQRRSRSPAVPRCRPVPACVFFIPRSPRNKPPVRSGLSPFYRLRRRTSESWGWPARRSLCRSRFLVSVPRRRTSPAFAPTPN